MSVLSRVRTVSALAAVFLGGWMGGGLATGRTLASAHAETAAPPSTAEVATCTDRLAMEANANLVGQLHDYKGRLAIAQEHAKEATAIVATIAEQPPSRIVTTREEWARMAREGTVRVRVPCPSWNAGARFSVRKARHGTSTSSSSRAFETGQRASAAGLKPEELETLDDVYRRARARTWAAMRSVCESNSDYQEAIAEKSEVTETTRVALCRYHLLDGEAAPTRNLTVRRVAELRAAGSDRATTDAQRVLVALTNGPPVLYEEMVRAFGREKATRAIDNGVMCFDETVYDLRAPDPDPDNPDG